VLALMHVTMHVLLLSERVAAGDLAAVAEVEALLERTSHDPA